MTQKGREGGRGTLVGLSAVILGGLLFAAGIMVGRQLSIQESNVTKSRLEQIDERDRKSNQIDTDGLTFHEELSKPSKIRQEPKKEPEPAPKSTQEPIASTTPTLTPVPEKDVEGKIKLQVASFIESSKAEQFKDKLIELGFGNLEIVEGDVEGKTYFRVRLGPYLDRQAATRDIEALENHGLNALLLTD